MKKDLKMRGLLVIVMTFVLLLSGCSGGLTPGGSSSGDPDPTPVNLGDKLFLKDGKYIYFGSYPQSKVSDQELKDALMSIAGDTDTWTSYDYYVNGDSLRYMVYKDVRHEGEKFRGVYFSEFRPYSTGVISSEENSLQDDNGYKVGKVYWFRYEPIKWKILSSSDGKAFLCTQQIIDSQDFNHSNKETFLCYASNYEQSSIRNWLNGTFYNDAFTAAQKELILTTDVDNSALSAGDDYNPYTCENTKDKVFLLSVSELSQENGFKNMSSGIKKATPYAKAQGISVEMAYASWWWLRSPYEDYNDYTCCVSDDGAVGGFRVTTTYIGVVPAINLDISGE